MNDDDASTEQDNDNDTPICPTCRSAFVSFAGQRVHERRAHPETFHTAETARLASLFRASWGPEEVTLMVSYVGTHPNEAFINEAIKRDVFPHRTIEVIKGKRRQWL